MSQNRMFSGSEKRLVLAWRITYVDECITMSSHLKEQFCQHTIFQIR